MRTPQEPFPASVSSFPRGDCRRAHGWDRFWFRPADPLPLGFIRICAGMVILYIHLIYSLDLQALVGKDAWVDESVMNYLRNDAKFYAQQMTGWTYPEKPQPYDYGQPLFSVYYHITQPGWVVAMHVTFLLAMFLFTIGFCTRLTAVLTWVGVISYVQRCRRRFSAWTRS